jgi:peptide/nickel transport system permease protein
MSKERAAVSRPTPTQAPIVSAKEAGSAWSGPWLRTGRRLVRHPNGLFGICVLSVYAVAAVLGPFVLPFDPTRMHLDQALLPPSAQHLFGTDQLGRDELTRIIFGARYTLALGVAAVAIGLAIGVPLGAVSGYFGGWLDLLVQRVTDTMLSFPGILLSLALIAGLGVGLTNVVISVGVSSIPGFVRQIRASVLSVRELPYVEAARALGASPLLIIFRHVVPNCIAPVVVQASVQLGVAILVAAGLGFLGLGVQPPTPEWGTMLADARDLIFRDPNLATIPGLAICLAVLGFNLLGDGLRDVLDPRLHG